MVIFGINRMKAEITGENSLSLERSIDEKNQIDYISQIIKEIR